MSKGRLLIGDTLNFIIVWGIIKLLNEIIFSLKDLKLFYDWQIRLLKSGIKLINV